MIRQTVFRSSWIQHLAIIKNHIVFVGGVVVVAVVIVVVGIRKQHTNALCQLQKHYSLVNKQYMTILVTKTITITTTTIKK